jgi:hypothetical protein
MQVLNDQQVSQVSGGLRDEWTYYSDGSSDHVYYGATYVAWFRYDANGKLVGKRFLPQR